MKNLKTVLFALCFVSISIYAQKTECNVKNGYAIVGYDVVAYFSNKAIKGKSKYTFSYNDIKYKFSTNENLEKFKLDPEHYIPQYGGWCAYAMGTKGEKVDMDPKVFEIRDDKLYLFYDSYFTHTYKKWLSEGPEELKENANQAWKKIINE